MRHARFQRCLWTVFAVVFGLLFVCLLPIELAEARGPRSALVSSVFLVLPLAALCGYFSQSTRTRVECWVTAAIGVLVIPVTYFVINPMAEEKMLTRLAFADRVSNFCQVHFQEMDKNGDGVVHQNELQEFMSPEFKESDCELLTHIKKNIAGLGHVVGVVAVRRTTILFYGFNLDEARTYPARIQARSEQWRE